MRIALTMPQFGESIHQGRIVRWLKKEGESVDEKEPLVEMETEKAIFTHESPFRGRLLKVLEGEEREVQVGVPIAEFDVSDDDGKKYLSVGAGQALETQTPVAPAQAATAQSLAPPVRPPAKEQGAPGVKILPVSPIRARIADNMVFSKQHIPHAGCGLDVDLAVIAKWRAGREKAPGYLPFALVAVVKALQDNPILNSSWKEGKEGDGKRWIEQYDDIHLGIAMATEQGLIVPVIRNAHTLSFRQMIAELERLTESGRKGTLTVQELTGATFTVNNAGALGTVRSDQIIPPSQAGIMAFNRIVKRAWVVPGDKDGDKIEVRPIVDIDISFDHRLIDGDLGARFLMSVRRHLENFDFSLVDR